jgi:hypothetical protein
MKMILQSNRWDCVPTAFAMCLDVLPLDIYEYIGHDGSEIIWPELEEPYRRRSFHIDEMIDFCMGLSYAPVFIDREPIMSPMVDLEKTFLPYRKEFSENRWNNYLKYHDAVLLGFTKSDKPHAVAWSHHDQLIYDPEGFRYGKLRLSAISGQSY